MIILMMTLLTIVFLPVSYLPVNIVHIGMRLAIVTCKGGWANFDRIIKRFGVWESANTVQFLRREID